MDALSRAEELVSRMTVEEKIGGCCTFELCGTKLTTNTYEVIEDLHCAGLRVTPHIYTAEPYGTRGEHQRLSFYALPEHYAGLLNSVQRIAEGTRLGIPLHVSADQEGDFSQDLSRGGVNLFPSQMGMAAIGDDDLVNRSYRAVARQLRAMGVRWLHSPSADVNTNPRNPEISTRSFSDDPETCARLVELVVRAFRQENVVATAKHFPGRGDSSVDVHHEKDSIPHPRERLDEVELLPFARAIKAGIPSVMVGHTAYPALDPSGAPASVSRRITHDLLRNDLGFEGVITTDAMGMAGIGEMFQSYGHACAEAVRAGADLVLAKCHAERQKDVIAWLTRYVREGLIPPDELDAHNVRVVAMKIEYGMFESRYVEPEKVEGVLRDAETVELSREAAEKACVLVRDADGCLPLPPDARVLVVEPHYRLWQAKADDAWHHPQMLSEFMREHASGFRRVIECEAQLEPTEDDLARVCSLADAADYCVVLSFWWRGNPTSRPLAEELLKRGKKVIVVSGSPYEEAVAPGMKCVLVTFAALPRSLEAAAKVLYGKLDARGGWPLKGYTLPG